MTRLRINGVEEEVDVTTVSELLAARGVDPAADDPGAAARVVHQTGEGTQA